MKSGIALIIVGAILGLDQLIMVAEGGWLTIALLVIAAILIIAGILLIRSAYRRK